MFMVYENGVVVVDAPPPFAQHIPKAIAEVTNKSITHLGGIPRFVKIIADSFIFLLRIKDYSLSKKLTLTVPGRLAFRQDAG